MNQNILTSLSIITSFHDQNKGIHDAFLPLVEYGIAVCYNEADNPHGEVEHLRGKICASSGININITVLKSLLQRLACKGRIELMDSDRCYRIKKSFAAAQHVYLDELKDKTRTIRKFIKAYREYSKNTKNDYEIIDAIYEFIYKYITAIDIKGNEIVADIESQEYTSFLSFLKYINEYDKELTATFNSIYVGVNMYTLLQSQKDPISKKALKELVVYLDSNFILRLLDLQEEHFTNETKELFNIIKENNIQTKIFYETIEEIRSVLDYYLEVYKANKSTYKFILPNPDYIDGVLGAFFRHNYTFTDIESLIDSIEETIIKNGIRIDSISRYNFTADEDKVAKLYQYKYLEKERDDEKIRYRTKKCEHYILIEEIIDYLRTANLCMSSCLGDSKYVFLTCDLKLFKYSQETRQKRKFPAIINQEVLANDLLLFNPQGIGRIPLDFLISVYQNSKYIGVSAVENLKDTIVKIAKNNPDEAKYVVAATRNCEGTIINEMFSDEKDDVIQLLELAKKMQADEKELKEKIKNYDDKISELIKSEQKSQEEATIAKDGETKALTTVTLWKEKYEGIKSKNVKNFIHDKKKFKLAYSICAVWIEAIIDVMLIAGEICMAIVDVFNGSNSWWVHCIVFVSFIITTAFAVHHSSVSKWAKKKLTQKEKELLKKYSLTEDDVSNIN